MFVPQSVLFLLSTFPEQSISPGTSLAVKTNKYLLNIDNTFKNQTDLISRSLTTVPYLANCIIVTAECITKGC